MDENKEAFKKDLRLVLQINAKLDYANQEEVKKVYAAITEKNIVSTSVGKKYAYKLKQIINGNEKYSCMFCNTVIAEKSFVCKTCLNRLLPKRVENETNKVETITQPKISPKVSASIMINQEKIEKAKEDAKKVIQKADQKIHELDEKADIKNKASGLLEYIKRFWNGRSKKQKIVIISILVILLVGMFAGGEDGVSSENLKIANSEDAYRVVSTLYSESEYDIIAKQAINPAKEMFEVSVGEYVGDSWTGETCKAYVFFIQSKKEAIYSAVLWVNEEGRIVGNGSLISGVNEDITQSYLQYRIK